MISRQRLGIEDVEIGRAEMALVEGGDQVRHDDERAASGIDDPRPLRQPADALAIQEAARLRRLGQQSDEDVAFGQQAVEI